MIFKKPNFWDKNKPNIISVLLIPLTLPLHISNFFLNKFKKNSSKEIYSICVGNIYIGGTGKTPSTIKLFQILEKIYKKVTTAKKFYYSQRDEISLLKKKTNFLTSKNRLQIINEAIKKGFKIIIFDDGLQDKNINYDLKVVCFDTLSWIGNGQLIPSGPLREKINSLKKYDVVLLKNINQKNNNIIKLIKTINPKIKIYNTRYIIKNLNKFNLKNKYVAFSGIGNPDSFKMFLKKNKFNIVDNIIFPDHYKYKKNDIINIIKNAKSINAQIITTEKDFIKIPKSYQNKINFINIDIEIAQINNLIKFLKKKIND
jgi:tetraacyldisaccharide 4'-kinase